ncbi:SMC-Scp complex subunit ScpB [Zhenhengia yiwuensis]|uniref:SMC-Scp complex subunit ScpB n=1 Tax=Zhenhengia yiwuensis TaxID=2763666 RepID=A0A926ELK6_9FIRM|nr:SMC-Scp complex subunit ScpB [Zhenhengia yiwuensis]MBC8580322.1 SMC-Scp complex subunit ScpB [Zhenhengia yiwuensis]
MQKTELESKLESLLFFVGDSIPSSKLCEVCETEEITIHMAIYRLNEIYKKSNSGIEIIEVNNGYQMCTVPKNIAYIQKYKQKPIKRLLTQALLETLAIVAYSQPITKAQIEDIRGVRSEHAVSKLLEYDLIEEVGRLNVIGRPILFGTTTSFLRHFGFKTIEELPKVKEELIERFKKEIEEEMNYISEE